VPEEEASPGKYDQLEAQFDTESRSAKDNHRPKTRGANARDEKMKRDAAREVGVDEQGFGDYIHKVKDDLNHRPSENFSYEELLDLAREFQAAGGR
jgi:hypothetical protein